MKINKKIFYISLAFFLLMAIGSSTTFAIEQSPLKIPVYLKLDDPSGKFDVVLKRNGGCDSDSDESAYRNAKDPNVEGLKFIGCSDNSTRFTFNYEGANIMQPTSAVYKGGGLSFPIKGSKSYENPMSMNHFCGKKATDEYNIWMSISPIKIDSGTTKIDAWVVNLIIENKPNLKSGTAS